MNIAINGKDFGDDKRVYIRQLFELLGQRNIQYVIHEDFLAILARYGIELAGAQVYATGSDLSEVNFMFSLGGDGTFLESVTHMGRNQKPILGINTGRLGFLANVPKERIAEGIHALMQNSFDIDQRAMVYLESDIDLFGETSFGLNEFAIMKRDSSSMITVITYIDGEYLNSYWGDGLIVSTPTGSTGYSLSCGGPVVIPHSHNFVITPVCPHNLNVRPMVVSDSSIISFEITGRGKNFLVSLDSRSVTVDARVQLAIKKADFKVKMIKIDQHNFLDTLRNKLNWGLDIRN